MNLTVFTTVIGQTDSLKEPTVVNPSCRYLCFSDRPLVSKAWNVVQVDPTANPIKESRRLKILVHETLGDDVDASLWLDAAFRLDMDPVPIANKWLFRADILALRHPDRVSIVDEGAEIVRLGKAPANLIDTQLEQYRVAGFTREAQKAITSTGFCLRRHAPRVEAFNKAWWKLFDAAGHTRDQMSVDFAAWKVGVDIAYLEGHYRSNPYARWHKQ